MNDDDKIKMPVTILLRHFIKKFCHYIKFTLKKVSHHTYVLLKEGSM